jgi:hypothetical protein
MVRSATSTAGKKESSSELNSQSIHRLLTLPFEQDRDESQAAHHLSMQAWIGIASLRFAFTPCSCSCTRALRQGSCWYFFSELLVSGDIKARRSGDGTRILLTATQWHV